MQAVGQCLTTDNRNPRTFPRGGIRYFPELEIFQSSASPRLQVTFLKKGIAMLLRRSLSLLVFACGFAAAVGILFGGSSAFGATLTWDNGANNLQWDTTSQNWTGQYWSDGNAAVFSTAGTGTITVVGNAGNVTATSLTFNANGYNLTGGQITLNGGAINVAAGDNATIGSAISATSASTAALTKSGLGTLTIDGISATTMTGANGVAGKATASGLFVNQGTLAVIAGGFINPKGLELGTTGAAGDTPTFSQSGGTVSTSGIDYLGAAAGNGLSTFNLSGGSFFAGGASLLVGGFSNCVASISGGSLTSNVSFNAGGAAGVTGTINLSNTATIQEPVSSAYLLLGDAAGARRHEHVGGNLQHVESPLRRQHRRRRPLPNRRRD